MSDNRKLFTTEIPYIGEVSMLFYVPECEEKDMIASIIEKHGGRLSNFHESCTYQINPIYSEVSHKDFFIGEVYRATWLTDSIKGGELLDKDDYLIATYTAEDKQVKKLSLATGQAYTISEAVKINELASGGNAA